MMVLKKSLSRRILDLLRNFNVPCSAGDISQVLYGGIGTATKPVLDALDKMEKEGLIVKNGRNYSSANSA